MKRRRVYSRTRRAYVPRLWPQIVLTIVLTVPPAWIIRNPLLTGPVAFVVGLAIGYGRLWIWRRRHPQITPSELIDDMCKQAVWN